MGVYRKQGAWWIDWYEGRRRLGKKTPARTKTEAKKLLEKFKVPSFKESPRVSAGPGFKRTGTSSRAATRSFSRTWVSSTMPVTTRS